MNKRLFIVITLFVSTLLLSCKKAEITTTANKIYYKQYVGQGSTDEPFARVTVNVSQAKASLKNAKVTLQGSSNLSDVTELKIYTTGVDTVFNVSRAELLGTMVSPDIADIECKLKAKLPIGKNNIWLTCNIDEKAKEGNIIKAIINTLDIAGEERQIEQLPKENLRQVLLACNTVYDLNQDGSRYYRIPAIVTAADGSLVALIDKRGDIMTDLPNTISIVARRSTDGGKTWGNAVTIAQGDSLKGKTYGDVAVVLDKVTKNLVAVFAGDRGLWDSNNENPQRIYTSQSADNGLTWSTPCDITEQVYKGVYGRAKWYGMFAGSGHALQLSDGRLMFVVAARYTPDKWELHNYAVYSDDHGKTWKVSRNSPTPSSKNRGDEAKVVELANGDILMSIRNPEKGYRKFAISKTKGETWQAAKVSDNLIEPACNGDILRYNHGGKDYLIHSLPSSKTDRENVTIHISEDNGKTWSIKRQLVDGMSAYSSLTILDDGTIGCLVEVGRHHTATDEIGMRIIYYNFSLDWIFD